MTKKDFLKQKLLKKISGKLYKEDFTLNKSLAEFTKKNIGGWNKFQIVFLDRSNKWELNPSMLIRKNVVEGIFHQISEFEPRYQKGTPTIGVSIEEYVSNGGKYRFILSEEGEIDEIAESLIKIFHEIALPFFSKFDSLEEIESAVNKDPNDILLTGGIFKGFKGIILARLLNRPNYIELSKTYSRYYQKFSNGFYLHEYNNLLNLLDQKV